MVTEFRFEGLQVYQQSLRFSSQIFTLTKVWDPVYRFSLGDQLNRAALSIPLNIAEGSSRKGKDFQHFLVIARGSCFECIPILTIAYEKNLVSKKDYEIMRSTLSDLSKMLGALRAKIV